MNTPDLVFRGRRLSSDHALVLGAVPVLDGDPFAAREAVSCAVGDGADLVSLSGAAAAPLVAWARQKFTEVVIGVETADAEVATACCAAGADLILTRADLTEVAAAFGTGYAAPDVSGAVARGVPAAGIVQDGGVLRTAAPLPQAGPVLVGVAGDGTPGGLALAALAAANGVAMIRTSHVRETRHVVEMAASIAGTRPPAKAVRWE
jgi:dihydropteroate synthase